MTVEIDAPATGDSSSHPSRPVAMRAGRELFLISFLILFLELGCIRWFGSTVIFLTFFTNIVLMACFLGVSVGCLAARRRWSWINILVPMMLAASASAVGLLWLYNASDRLLVDVGSQVSPQFIYFGTDARLKDPTKWVLPIELLAAFFFAMIALMFVGPGQEMGRRFAVIENRLAAYTLDILGSLAGIATFGLMSYLRMPATVWFAIALMIGVGFVPRRRWLHGVGGLIALAMVAFADWPWDSMGVATEVIWSPYYQVRFKPRFQSIDVNNLRHQGMIRVDWSGPAYQLPYRLNQDAGGKPFGDVMIIGAGSGNDVVAALTQGARHVDAVEIDPVINELGRLHHPNRPYNDPRVSIHLDDGRSFVRKTDRQYDMICYAIVDSLALHSSYSSVRLESFLFTEEAFRDVKAKLKPGGVFVMYNFYRTGWVVGRLVRLVEKVFGTRPLVISMPYQEVIAPENNQRGYTTCLMVDNEGSKIVEAIRSRFQTDGPLWITSKGWYHNSVIGDMADASTSSGASLEQFARISPARVEQPEFDELPTDDWPFLYLREPKVPALSLRGIAIVAVLSMVILVAFVPVRRARPNGQMFFLGAGFMLLETKGVVHMALLFGATWMVNSIVFFAILTMILLSNLYVLAMRPRRTWPYYALLLVSLAVNAAVPMGVFLALPGAGKVVASCSLVYLPVFFAGVIFATVFRSSRQPDIDFGSNIGGIILGGLSEYLSLVVGFNHLLWIAIGYYLLSAWLSPRVATVAGE
ncbi:MAG: spermidine synthase [Isosphaeraceae bacterium]